VTIFMALCYMGYMRQKEIKTTIVLEKDLFRAAKSRALKQEITLKELFRRALLREVSKKPTKSKKVNFGVYNLGKFKGNL